MTAYDWAFLIGVFCAGVALGTWFDKLTDIITK